MDANAQKNEPVADRALIVLVASTCGTLCLLSGVLSGIMLDSVVIHGHRGDLGWLIASSIIAVLSLVGYSYLTILASPGKKEVATDEG